MGREEVEDQIAQVECPNCGKTHDIDYPKYRLSKMPYKYYD